MVHFVVALAAGAATATSRIATESRTANRRRPIVVLLERGNAAVADPSGPTLRRAKRSYKQVAFPPGPCARSERTSQPDLSCSILPPPARCYAVEPS